MNLTVYPLDLGELELDHSFVVWQTNCGQRQWYPAMGYLIAGAGPPVVVDTGFRSAEDAAALQGLRCRRSPDQTMEAQLGRHGLRCGDVRHVVLTHLHMDHAGQAHLFDNARFHVRRRELQHAAAPDLYPRPFYDRLNVARLIDPLGNRVDLVDGDGEVELLPGVRLVSIPGHTPAHQAVYVDTDSGTTAIAGDAAMSVEWNVRRQTPPGFTDNMADVTAGLRKLARDAKHVLATHVAEAFERYPDGVSGKCPAA